MKVLVYGSGVIGCYLAHILCTAGNDVTLLARGQWKEQLQRNGLRIRHHLQRKTTLDHPRVIGSIEEEKAYDAVFAVMPYNKMQAILEPLAAVRSPIVVLVGNNMSPAAMHREILERSVCGKQVLFGFQTTAGKRDHEKGMLVCERAGIGAMDIGGLHSLPDSDTKTKLETMFSGSRYKLHWQPDMEAYLICHLAAVLPICYLAYACNGDLTDSTGTQRKLMRMASREAYAMLKTQGIPILPEGDDQYYASGIKGMVMQFLYFGMAKWKTAGDLIACEHCRNAFEEMEMLDVDFEKVLAHKPEFPMPNWRALKAQMPGWDTIRKQYAKGSKK
ncbi:MAG: ketopantoate reductase family protein [Oscillospiraceae bacterium]|nr:ketopantoate reductase family protein [Oscillospiraceae bacterium]